MTTDTGSLKSGALSLKGSSKRHEASNSLQDSNSHVKPVTAPASEPSQDVAYRPTGTDYHSDNYQLEKDLNIRRADGARKHIKLRPWHVQAVKLHLGGLSHDQIAKVVRKHPTTICVLLQDEKVQKMVQRGMESVQQEFKGLKGKAVGALRDGLFAQDNHVKLKAAALYFKENERLEASQGDGTMSPEDVMAQMFNQINARDVQINVVNMKKHGR